MRSRKMLVVVAVGLMVSLAIVGKGAPMGTAWTYQGRLMDDSNPADGLYDFLFGLFDGPEGAGELGVQVIENQDVIDGYFTVELDFGSDIFDGSERWLQIEVRPGELNDPSPYTPLSIRHNITPTPYALHTRGIFVDSAENIGIGTTNPISKLSFGTTWNPKMLALWDGVEDFYGFGTDIGRMTFYAMNSEVMTLNSLGWLGLGTPFPAGYLDITGTADAMTLVRINQTGNKQYNGLRLDRDGVEKWFVGMTHTDDNLTFRRNASSNDMVIKTDNGYVGIGTANPQQLLHVFGLYNPRILVEAPSNVTPELNLKRGSEAWGMYIGSNAGLNFFHNGTVASFSNGGNFGIGTTNPADKLHVNQSTGSVGLRVSSDAASYQYMSFGAENGYSIGRDLDDMFFINRDRPLGTGRERLVTIHTDGAVGIGTKDPIGTLHVIGCLTASMCSDIRLKKSIEPLPLDDSILDRVMGLQAVTFEWKHRDDGKRQIGLIAQEVEEVFPEVVTTPDDGSCEKGLLATGLDAVLVEAIKELKVENELLKDRIETLERMIQQHQRAVAKEVQ